MRVLREVFISLVLSEYLEFRSLVNVNWENEEVFKNGLELRDFSLFLFVV